MLEASIELGSEIADDWAIRSEFWISQSGNIGRKRLLRERNPNPLILTGHGCSLRIEHGALLISDGFTHYPQKRVVHRLFPGSREIPSRILLLDGSGSLSFDVLSWLAEQSVPLVRVKWTGEVAVVSNAAGYAADPDKLRWQHRMRDDNAERLAFATDLIGRKLANCITTLETRFDDSARRSVAIDKHLQGIDRLASDCFADINDIRAIEGECASAYFAAWQDITLHWKGTARRAIPESWHSYSGRSSLATGAKAQNRGASHPVNAVLNYAYAVKQAQLHIEAVASGHDPSLGIMHLGRRGKPAYIFDLIEPERPQVDAAMLDFIAKHGFASADFLIRPDGVCRLSPQLARAVAATIAAT